MEKYGWKNKGKELTNGKNIQEKRTKKHIFLQKLTHLTRNPNRTHKKEFA